MTILLRCDDECHTVTPVENLRRVIRPVLGVSALRCLASRKYRHRRVPGWRHFSAGFGPLRVLDFACYQAATSRSVLFRTTHRVSSLAIHFSSEMRLGCIRALQQGRHAVAQASWGHDLVGWARRGGCAWRSWCGSLGLGRCCALPSRSAFFSMMTSPECQGPIRSAHWRTVELPVGGHQFLDRPATTRFSCRSIHSRVCSDRAVGSGTELTAWFQVSNVLPVGNPAVFIRVRIEDAWRPVSSSVRSARSVSTGSQRCARAVASRSGAWVRSHLLVG